MFVAVGCKTVSDEEAIAEYNASTETFMKDYNEKMDALNNDTTISDDDRRVQIQELYTETVDKFVADRKDIIKKNGKSQLAVVVLQDIYSMLEQEELEDVLGQIKGEAADTSKFIGSLREAIAAKKATAEGQMFTDFTVVQDPENAEATTVRFSDFVGKGKYVLVDFWASWCGPCKGEIPNIAAVYEKYKGDDFDVLSIAVWDKPEDTKASAAEHGIVWSQIINAQRIPTDIYGIEGIPHIMLVGPDGTILKRNLRGENIEKAVAEALGR